MFVEVEFISGEDGRWYVCPRYKDASTFGKFPVFFQVKNVWLVLRRCKFPPNFPANFSLLKIHFRKKLTMNYLYSNLKT